MEEMKRAAAGIVCAVLRPGGGRCRDRSHRACLALLVGGGHGAGLRAIIAQQTCDEHHEAALYFDNHTSSKSAIGPSMDALSRWLLSRAWLGYALCVTQP